MAEVKLSPRARRIVIEPTRYVQCDIVHDPEQPEGERDIVSPRIDQ